MENTISSNNFPRKLGFEEDDVLPYYLVIDYYPSNLQEFRILLKDGVSVFHGNVDNAFKNDRNDLVEYIYDAENTCLHISSDPYNLFENVVDVAQIFMFKPMVRTKENFPKIKKGQQRKVTDYSQIITQLEKAGIVKTIPTKSVMAIDQRKFEFTLPENYDMPFDYMDVDFLGTTLANDISQKVCNIYRQTFNQK